MSIIAVDTSVAVPLLSTNHPQHAALDRWAAGQELHLGERACLETYAVLTRPPGGSRVGPEDTAALIRDTFTTLGQRHSDTDLPGTLSAAGIAGGASYDAVVALDALSVGARLATRDRRALGTYERLGVEILRLA